MLTRLFFHRSRAERFLDSFLPSDLSCWCACCWPSYSKYWRLLAFADWWCWLRRCAWESSTCFGSEYYCQIFWSSLRFDPSAPVIFFLQFFCFFSTIISLVLFSALVTTLGAWTTREPSVNHTWKALPHFRGQCACWLRPKLWRTVPVPSYGIREVVVPQFVFNFNFEAFEVWFYQIPD